MNSVILDSLSNILPTLGVVVFAVVILELLLYVLLKQVLNYKHALAVMLVAPAAIGLLLLVAYPLIYNVITAFSDINLYARRFPTRPGSVSYSLANFVAHIERIFSQPILKQTGFFPIMARTFLWTFLQVSVHVIAGMFIAMLLNRPMKLKGVYRTIILLPWAVPQVVALLAWRGEFNYEYGYFNVILKNLGLDPINWISSADWNFLALNLANWWLGIPFMSVVLLGGLQSIDASYYEAAEMDGAGKWFQFRGITLPLMQPVMTPAIILGVIWTFNNFNVSYFINQQELESSDILVTALYRAAFEYQQHGFAAAFSIVIFVILLILTLLYMRITKFNLGTTTDSRTLKQSRAVGE